MTKKNPKQDRQQEPSDPFRMKRARLTISAKVALTIIGMSVFVLFVLVFVGIHFSTSISETRMRDWIQESIDWQDVALLDLLEDRIGSVTLISAGIADDVREMSESGPASVLDDGIAGKVFREISLTGTRPADFDYISVLDAETGRVMISTDPGQEGQSHQDRLPSVWDERGYSLIPVSYDRDTRERYAIILVPVVHERETVGVVEARVDLASIDSVISATRITEAGGYSILSDAGGNTITAVGECAFFGEGLRGDYTERCRSEEESDVDFHGRDGAEYLGAHRWLPGYEMCLSVGVSTDAIAQSSLQVMRSLSLVGFFIFVAFALFSVMLSRSLTGRIRSLKTATEKIAGGNFSQRIEVSGDDEVADLAKSFNTMSKQLTVFRGSIEDKVKARTAELEVAMKELKETEAELRSSLATQTLHGNVSALLLNITPENADDIVVSTLGLIGSAMGADRVFISRPVSGTTRIRVGLQWHVPEIADLSRSQLEFDQRSAPWCFRRMSEDGGFLMISDVGSADEAKESYASLSAHWGAESVMSVKIGIREDGLGCMTLITAKGRKADWDADSLAALQSIGEVMAMALISSEASGKAIEEKERFETLFHQSRDPYLIFTRERFLECNRAALELFQYPDKRDFLKLALDRLSPKKQASGDDSQSAARRIIDAVMREGSQSFEWTYMKADGTLFPALVVLTRLDFHDEVVIHASIRDNTERYKAREILRKRHGLALELLSAHTLSEGLTISLDTAIDFAGADGGGIYLFDETADKLELKVHTGLSEEFVNKIRSYDADSERYQLVRKGVPVYARLDDFPLSAKNGMEREGIRMLAMIPVKTDDTVIGALNLAWKRSDSIGQLEKELVESVVTEIARAVARLEAEAAHRESELKYRTIVENTVDIFFQVDREGKIIFVSPQVAIYGYEPERVIGTNFAEYVHEADRAKIPEAMKKLMQTAGGRCVDVRMVGGDRKEYWFELTVRPLTDGNGKTYLLGVMRDITKRKEIEGQLRMAQFTVDSNVMPILWVDAEGKVAYANSMACRALEYTEQEMRGKNMAAIDTETVAGGWSRNWEEMSGRKTRTNRSVFRTATGKEFPVEVSSNFIEFEGGQYDVIFFSDQTERKSIELQLHRNVVAQSVISEISRDLLSMSPETSATVIETVLNRVGTFYGCDRVSLCLLNGNRRSSSCDYEWVRMGVMSRKDREDADSFAESWWNDTLDTEGVIAMDHLSDIPVGAVLERAHFESIGAKSFLAARIGSANSIVGHITVEMMGAPRDWEMHEMSYLRTIADLFFRAFEYQEYQRKLLKEKETAQLYLDSANVMMLVLGLEGEVLLINEKGLKIFGLKRESIQGKNWFEDFIPQDQRDAVRRVFNSIIEGRDEYLTYENPIVTAGGEERLILWKNSLMRDASGRIVGTLSSGLDITEQRKSEMEMAKEREKFRRVFETSNDALMLLDEKQFFDANEATVRLFGCRTKEEFIGKHPGEVSPPTQPDGTPSKDAANERIATAFRKGKNFFEWTHRRADGTDFPATVLLTPLELDGRPVLQATVRDITEQKAAESKISSLERMKSRFITALTHVTRTPLNKIRWSIESLASGEYGRLSEEQMVFVRQAHDSEIDILRVLRNIDLALDLERGMAVLDRQPTSLVSLMNSEVAEIETETRAEGIAWTVMKPKDLIPEINLDPEKIRLVIEILLENAARYIGEGKKSVTVSFKKTNGGVRCDVTDTGIGIPKIEQPHIFDRFFRASTGQLAYPDGMGIGLYIAKSIVELHGGAIGCDSKEGKGSTFWFVLPLG